MLHGWRAMFLDRFLTYSRKWVTSANGIHKACREMPPGDIIVAIISGQVAKASQAGCESFTDGGLSSRFLRGDGKVRHGCCSIAREEARMPKRAFNHFLIF